MASASSREPIDAFDPLAVLEEAKAVYNSDAWEPWEESEGIAIQSMKVEGCSMKATRGDTIFEGLTAQQVSDALMDRSPDQSRRKEWDDLYLGGEILEELSDTSKVIYVKFDSGSRLVSNRDMVSVTHSVEDPDGVLWSFGRSVERAEKPNQKGFVRAVVHLQCFRLENLPENGGCKVTIITHLDPNGMVPAWLANKVSKKQPMNLLKIRDYAKKCTEAQS